MISDPHALLVTIIMKKSPQQIYVEQLLPRVGGHPLWYPEPGDQMPTDTHREVGIVPGDVGYFTPDGDFVYLFHVFSGPGAPLGRGTDTNCWGTPVDFCPIQVPNDNHKPPLMKRLPVFTRDRFIASTTEKSLDISLESNAADPTG